MRPDRAFIVDLQNALLHLNDPTHLEGHPLSKHAAILHQFADVSYGYALRRLLCAAIEMLQPDPAIPADSPDARPYEVVCRHYIRKQSMAAVALDLGIGERQAYRELRRGVGCLALLLGESSPGVRESDQAAKLDSGKIGEELERLHSASDQRVDIAEVVKAAVAIAQRLADDRGIKIHEQIDVPSFCFETNRVMLRQAILNLLSHMIVVDNGEGVAIGVELTDDAAQLWFTFHPVATADPEEPGQPCAVSEHLFRSLGMHWSRSNQPGGGVQVSIQLPAPQESTVLIIDDNSGMVDLLKRYLQHQPYKVCAATDFATAVDTFSRVHPTAVILDVMMPDRDGWDILEHLRATAPGHEARVIVCSVINDPDLAFALGADAFLHKPVSRTGLLTTLERLLSKS